MSRDVAYLDASAFLKLVVAEPETKALRQFLRRWPRRASAGLLKVEALIQARRHGSPAVAQAQTLLRSVVLINLDGTLLDSAANLAPSPTLRSLDAIHLAAARTLGGDLGPVVTYDARLAGAARHLGMLVESPA